MASSSWTPAWPEISVWWPSPWLLLPGWQCHRLLGGTGKQRAGPCGRDSKLGVVGRKQMEIIKVCSWDVNGFLPPSYGSSPPPASICTCCCVFQKQSCATLLYFFSWALRCTTRNRGLADPFLTETHIAMPSTSDGSPSRVRETSRPADASAIKETTVTNFCGRSHLHRLRYSIVEKPDCATTGIRFQRDEGKGAGWMQMIIIIYFFYEDSGWKPTCCRVGWTAACRDVICQIDKRKKIKTQSHNHCCLQRQSSKCM